MTYDSTSSSVKVGDKSKIHYKSVFQNFKSNIIYIKRFTLNPPPPVFVVPFHMGYNQTIICIIVLILPYTLFNFTYYICNYGNDLITLQVYIFLFQQNYTMYQSYKVFL